MIRGGLGAAAMVTISGPAAALRTLAQEASLKAAWVYVGPVSDDGWTAAHDEGRKAVEAAFPGKIETAFAESIPETPADAERVIRDFAQKGNKLIFTTSFGFMQPTINVAKDFPDTVFVHISGYMTAENVGTGFAKIEEPRYVSGQIAGKMTTSNKLGYVAAFPIPEVIRGINSFTLGVRKVNPAATVKVVWTSTWYNLETERAAAEALLDGGVDVTAQHQDSPATLQAAEARGVYGVGYDSPNMSAKAPKATLTSPIFNWGPFYTATAQAVLDGTWTTSQYWGGWQDGAVDLAPIGEMVPAEVKTAAEAEIAAFKAGEQSIYTIFTGPLNGQDGAEKVAAGTALTDEELLGMNWFVEGVEGEIPS
ncbi:MAG: BMP family ABC transporter substrate-binding protein [Thermomicrobiales bacterium]|nr:BMP family ABC transporter substrate-binding protein [Thermomicrobiales bacterium]